MDVSVIIVNYNVKQLIVNCIDSIFKQTVGIDFEIIIVDNASTDGSKELFEQRNEIVYIYNTVNQGFGKANNIGIQRAKGRNIFLLNPDTLLVSNAIKILSDFLDANQDIGACGGNLYNEYMQPVHSYRMRLPSILWELNGLSYNLLDKLCWGKNYQFNHTGKPKEVAYITGADLMIRRSVLDHTGVFSSHFFMYYEETELSFRIKKCGYHIFSVPDAKILHLEEQSFSKPEINERKIQFRIEGRITYYLLCCQKTERRIAYSIFCLTTLLKIVYLFICNNWEEMKLKIMTLRIFNRSLHKLEQSGL